MANKPTPSADEKLSVLSEAAIAKLKAKYGKIFVYTTEDGKVAYLRQPNRNDISAAAVFANGAQLQYRGNIAESCFVAGDRDILDVDKYYLAIQQKVEQMIEVVDGELKEL